MHQPATRIDPHKLKTMAKILIVEDDQGLVQVLMDHLKAEHHIVENAADGQTALDLLRTYDYDIVILDLTLPEVDGVEVCRRYRFNGGNARVLMLTGRTTVPEKEVGFDAGADDYLTKPFHVNELMARVRAMMRRTRETKTDVLKLGSLQLVPKLFEASAGDEKLKLTPREFALLEFLVRHPNEVYSAEVLLDSIWPSDTEASTANIKSYIYRLREKIGERADAPQIVTVHGVGYKLVFPPSSK